MQADKPTASMGFQNLVYATLFVILIGFILVIGKLLLLPIFVAIISVYVLVSASDWLGKQPFFRHAPAWTRRVLVALLHKSG